MAGDRTTVESVKYLLFFKHACFSVFLLEQLPTQHPQKTVSVPQPLNLSKSNVKKKKKKRGFTKKQNKIIIKINTTTTALVQNNRRIKCGLLDIKSLSSEAVFVSNLMLDYNIDLERVTARLKSIHQSYT